MVLRLVLVLFCFAAALLCLWKVYEVKAKLVARPPAGSLSVRAFGATGNGVTKDTAAFQRGLDAAAKSPTRTLDVPPGTYLLGSLVLPSGTTLNLEPNAILQGSDDASDYPLTEGRWEGVTAPVHRALLSAQDASAISITGQGTIRSGAHVGKLRNPRGPTLLEFTSCRLIHLQGSLTLQNENVWTVHPVFCRGVFISGLSISTRGRTADGIDPDSCQQVVIDHCTFATSDDCIAVKSGRGLDGFHINRPSEDITITNCRFDRGIGCLALGSEVSGGIRRITLRDCTFNRGLAAVYIKTNEARGGIIEDVIADRLSLEIPLLRIDTHYNFRPSPNDIAGPAGLTTIRRLRFTNVTEQSNQWIRSLLSWIRPKLQPGNLVDIAGDEKIPIEDLALVNLHGYDDRGLVIANVNHLQLERIAVKCAFTPLLTLSHDEIVERSPAPILDETLPAAGK